VERTHRRARLARARLVERRRLVRAADARCAGNRTFLSRRARQRRIERRNRPLRRAQLGARGVYAGAVGYIRFQDDMDLAIAIRTAVLRDGMLYVQAGAGIVHDSVPETEWQETLNKARAVLRAAELVQLGLDAEA
jgi:hypothetical protein